MVNCNQSAQRLAATHAMHDRARHRRPSNGPRREAHACACSLAEKYLDNQGITPHLRSLFQQRQALHRAPQLTCLYNGRVHDVPVRVGAVADDKPWLARANGTHPDRTKGPTTTYSPGGNDE
jgi:hypothetical protein